MMSLLKSFLFKKTPVSPQVIAQYKEYCLQAAQILTQAGKKIAPYNDEKFERLLNHSNPERVVENLGRWVTVYSEAIQNGESLLDDKKLLWRMLQKLGLTPASDLMELLKEGHTINIYTTDNWLIYFNLDFFDHIFATVDEIATIVWNKDSSRDMKVTTEAFRLVFLIKTKRLKETFIVTSIPKHSATFTFSNVPQKIEVDARIASPLFGKDGMSAYLLMQKTKRIY